MKKTRKNIKNNKNTKNTRGGKVLASGGYGCVFKPALKCESSNKRETNKISKLMTERHAIEEYEEINSIKEKLNTIKDYNNYFLLNDATLCKPSKLTKKDLDEFNSKCSALPKNNITKSNINSKLDEVMILNLPNGGLPVDDYIYENGSFVKLYKLHVKLLDLLKNGILQMNKKNIYHCDIKDSNVLVDDTKNNFKTRLIDWGLSTEYQPFKNMPFPSTWRNRPFQFNVPFSVVIFTDDFIEMYSKFIKDGGNYNNLDELKSFVLNYINYWMKERGAGHYKFMNEIFYLLYSNDIKNIAENHKPSVIETEFTMVTIVNYISNILLKYTKFKDNGNINLREYLDNVFIKNVDVWGFVTCYYTFLEMLSNNYKSLSIKEKYLFKCIKELFIKHLYYTSYKPINLSSLFKDLNKIKQILYDMIKLDNKQISEVEPQFKSNKKTQKIIFSKKIRPKRYKNPFFLSLK